MTTTKPSGLRLFALLAVFALVVVTCADADPTSTTQPAADTSTTVETDGAEGADGVETDVGGVFRIGLISNITTDNWFAALDEFNSTYNQAFLGSGKMAMFTLTHPGFVYVPELAATSEPVRAVQEGDIWVVEQPIRSDVIWSDGTAVSARDLAFYFDVQREFELGGNHVSSFVSSVVRVTAPADDLVRIEFDTKPGLAAWQHGVGLTSFVPAHFWQTHVEEARTVAAELAATITDQEATAALVDVSLADEDPGNDLAPEDITQEMLDAYVADLGADESRDVLYRVSAPMEPSSGPQIFDRWEPGVVAVTISNPGYFNKGTEHTLYSDGSVRIVNAARGEDNLYGGSGEGDVVSSYVEGPFVSEIHWIEHDTKDAAYNQLVAGEVDFVYDPTGLSSGLRDQLAAQPDLTFSVNQTERFRYMAFNMRKAPMSDLAFRQAVATIVNKEVVAETVLANAVFPAYTIIHPGLTSFYNADAPRAGWADGVPMSEADRFLSAVATLQDAGYTWDVEPVIDPGDPDPVATAGAGLTMPNGVKVPELTILAPALGYDPYRATFSVWIEAWLNDLGIPASAEPTDFETIVSAVFPPQTEETAQDWDLYVLGWTGGETSLRGTLQVAFFHSREDTVSGGGFNTPGYASERFDAAADAFESATDIETAARFTREMDLILAEELPYVVLFRTQIIEAYSTRVRFPTEVIMSGHSGFPNVWPSAVVIDEES